MSHLFTTNASPNQASSSQPYNVVGLSSPHNRYSTANVAVPTTAAGRGSTAAAAAVGGGLDGSPSNHDEPNVSQIRGLVYSGVETGALPSQSPTKSFLHSAVSERPPLSAPPPPPPPPVESRTMTALSYPSPSGGRAPSVSSQRRGSNSPTSTIDYLDIEQKQNELRHAVEYRVSALERTLSDRDEEVTRLKAQLRKMEEDYQFNYNLIAERDAALEDAATQLQRLCRDVKQLTTDKAAAEHKLELVTEDAATLRQRVRDVEAEREASRRRAEKEFAIKEEHLQGTLREKESALEQERERQHADYLQRLRSLEKEQAEFEERRTTELASVEERGRAQAQRLQADLDLAKKATALVKEELAQERRRTGEMEQQLSAAQKETWVLQQRFESQTEELAATRQLLETKQTQSLTQIDHSISALEDAVREETQRASRLELDKTRLQAELASVQERLQGTTTRRDEEAARHAAEVQELRQNYEMAQQTMTDLRKRWADAEEKLQLTVIEQARQTATVQAELLQQRDGGLVNRQQLEELRGARDKLQGEVDFLQQEVRRWKGEEAKSTARLREERKALEEQVLQLERGWEETKAGAERQRRVAAETQERLQSEVARLTRELHASEAARGALEEQFHLEEDTSKHGLLVQALRGEKEVLERQVHELERANGEIQQQIATFTLELQNDPLIKTAKETQARVQQLQEELLQSREEAQQLRDRLRDKEEEMGRYQLDILRSQLIVGGGAAGGSPTAPSPEQAALKEEYAALRQSYEALCAKFERQRRQQHPKRKVSCSSSSSSSRSSSSSSRASEDAKGKRRKKRTAVPVTTAPPPPPPLPDLHAATTPSSSYLLQEAELWRQKYLQLEQHLRTLLTERDRLRRELRISQETASSLQSEKQSLLDLNSLLKAQLREACRLSSVAAAASYSPSRAAATGASTPSGAHNRSTYTPELSEAERYLRQQQQRLAVDGVQPPSVRLSPHSRGDATSADVSQERLTALEEEIQQIKSQIAEARQRSVHTASPDGSRKAPSPAALGAAANGSSSSGSPLQQRSSNHPSTNGRSGSAASGGAAVLRKKGGSVIRNYAYQ